MEENMMVNINMIKKYFLIINYIIILSIKKHGFGIYYWADGRRYEGYWQYGK